MIDEARSLIAGGKFTSFITPPFKNKSQGLLSIFNAGLCPKLILEFTSLNLAYGVFKFSFAGNSYNACNSYIRPGKIHLKQTKIILKILLKSDIDFMFGDFNDPSKNGLTLLPMIPIYLKF
ncbi:hypothetical protein ACOME3_004853 [Neoechinorhynchus agilis]